MRFAQRTMQSRWQHHLKSSWNRRSSCCFLSSQWCRSSSMTTLTFKSAPCMHSRCTATLKTSLKVQLPLAICSSFSMAAMSFLFILNVHSLTGMLLRFFVHFYDMEIIEEEAFLAWKEDITQEFPGKGKALFQVKCLFTSVWWILGKAFWAEQWFISLLNMGVTTCYENNFSKDAG